MTYYAARLNTTNFAITVKDNKQKMETFTCTKCWRRFRAHLGEKVDVHWTQVTPGGGENVGLLDCNWFTRSVGA